MKRRAKEMLDNWSINLGILLGAFEYTLYCIFYFIIDEIPPTSYRLIYELVFLEDLINVNVWAKTFAAANS